ncbi:MAG: ABC transporter substrate-binding protein [Proteobacteria bacterium]|nr:ABC transporter substrate-binding protein [Pseudomonadota bacterium]
MMSLTEQKVRSSCLVLAVLLVWPGCNKDEPAGQADPQQKAANKSTSQPAGGDKGSPDPSAARSQAAARTAVTLQLNWTPEPEFGGFYAAVHKGIYAAQGLDVAIKAGAAGIQTWKMVATGKVAFAIASAGEVIRARMNDADLVALFTVYQTSPQGIMVHASTGVNSLEEVFTSGKIKKVAMESGLPYVHFARKKFGFDKVAVIQHGGNLSLFLQDPTMAQQCFVFAEPVSAKEQGVEVKAFSVAQSGFNPYLAVVIASQAYLDKNRAIVAKFVRATRAGWRDYLDDPLPSNQYMKEQKSPMSLSAMKLAAELQKPYIEGEETRKNYLGYMSEQRWAELAAQLKELGAIKSIPDISALFRNIPPGS